jgi:hypothetical protein
MSTAPCNDPLCVTATHILQTEALDRMIEIGIKAMKQQVDGLMNPRWISYLESLFRSPVWKSQFEGLVFDPFDNETLFEAVLKKMLDTPVLFVQTRMKCDTSVESFIRPLRQMISMSCEPQPEQPAGGVAPKVTVGQVELEADFVSIRVEDGKKIKIAYNLGKEPVLPQKFLSLDECDFLCDTVLETLLLDPIVHIQVLDQMLEPMPAFKVGLLKKRPEQKQKQGSRYSSFFATE